MISLQLSPVSIGAQDRREAVFAFSEASGGSSGGVQMPKPRARAYIDGYNFYYGVLKGTNLKWLDPVALVDKLLPEYDVDVVKYFTARIARNPWNDAERLRQIAYLDALSTLPRLRCTEGYYRERIKKKSLINPKEFGLSKSETWPMPRVNVLDQEEKGSDVSLGAHLVLDGCRGEYEVAIVVSNDADLYEPVRLVREELNLQVRAVVPATSRTKKYRPASVWRGRVDGDVISSLSWPLLRAAQLPDPAPGAMGPVSKPAPWFQSR